MWIPPVFKEKALSLNFLLHVVFCALVILFSVVSSHNELLSYPHSESIDLQVPDSEYFTNYQDLDGLYIKANTTPLCNDLTLM